MKYTDSDMAIMAIGEIGADLMTVMVAVVAFIYLNDLPYLIQLPLCCLLCVIINRLALGFVHLGYDPNEQSTH